MVRNRAAVFGPCRVCPTLYNSIGYPPFNNALFDLTPMTHVEIKTSSKEPRFHGWYTINNQGELQLMASQEHILIVGAGIFGASTAYHLTHPTLPSSAQALRGQIPRVTLLDSSPLGAGIGASEDINKIIRADYSQKFYMDLGYEAINAWKSLSKPGGILESLYHQTGWIVLDDEKSDDSARIRKLYSERGM
jgi:hypothetical protein